MSLVSESHAAELVRGALALGVELSEGQQQQLLAYLALLIKWNKAYNLTAVRDPDEMVSRHLLDSLSVVSFVAESGQTWLDVGSGGGMPGVPLAIMFPDRSFTLLDSNGKKNAIPDAGEARAETGQPRSRAQPHRAVPAGGSLRRHHLARLQFP